MRILMVCLGNICRSPMAEGILKSKVQERGLDWFVDSAGTGSWHIGENPDPRSVRTAKENGIDISRQRARQLRAEDLNSFDLLLAMDSSNYNNILALATSEEQKSKVKLLLNYSFPGQNRAVPDPYFEGGFQGVFDMIDAAADRLLEHYTKGE